MKRKLIKKWRGKNWKKNDWRGSLKNIGKIRKRNGKKLKRRELKKNWREVEKKYKWRGIAIEKVDGFILRV